MSPLLCADSTIGRYVPENRHTQKTSILSSRATLLEEYDEQLVRRLIEKITVYDDKLTIEFKSGVEVDV